MTTQQVIQLVVIALAIGLSAIGALIRKLNEQAAMKRAQTQMLRRREEALRTGRSSHDAESDEAPPHAVQMPTAPSQGAPVGPDEARRRFQEIAQRRRAEIEAQRAKRQGRVQGQNADGRSLPPSPPIVVFGPGGAQAARPVRPIPPSPRPIVSGRRDGGRTMTPQERHAEARRRAIQEQQARDRAAYEQSERVAVAAQRARLVQAAQNTARTEAAETAASARSSVGGLAGALGKIAGAADQSEAGVRMNELRRAVVLGELLGPPVSTRPQN